MDKNFLDTLSKDSDAYLISSAEDLCNLSEYVNAGNDCKDLIFKLANDIDLSDVENFTPIGMKDCSFIGTFDGDGKTIINLTITGNNDYVGLFGFVEADYQYDFFVNNLIFGINLIDVQISGKEYVGGLVGYNQGIIEDCKVSGIVSGEKYVGGLVGLSDCGRIKNCTISGTVNGKEWVGGLVGLNYKSRIRDVNLIDMQINGKEYVGGLVGYNDCLSTIKRCTFSGNVSGEENIGGLVGDNAGKVIVKDCMTSCYVCGTENVGGLVGRNFWGTIENCTAKGDVCGERNVDSLVGSNNGKIENCSASGNVSKRDEII